MDDRRRKLVFASILIVSLILLVYLMFLTPSESKIELPTPTVAATEASSATPNDATG